jgi:hypothetical protein
LDGSETILGSTRVEVEMENKKMENVNKDGELCRSTATNEEKRKARDEDPCLW